VLLHLEHFYNTGYADDEEDRDGEAEDDDASGKPVVLKRSWGSKHTVVCHLSKQRSQQLLQQLSQQLESLLFVGFKLDLQQLLQPALRFLRAHADWIMYTVIKDQADTIFTPRVLAAAGGASGAELLMRACVQRPLGLGFGIGSMFRDIGDIEELGTLMC
jgi:hypothetical protein